NKRKVEMAVTLPGVHHEHLSQGRKAASTAGAFDRDDATSRDRQSLTSARFMVLHKSRLTPELAGPLM
ncbi:MAG: hypothetical protein U9P00_02680, partial [Pseudomonadota bacterium]|nr:hypothetical protein [Pseudomonadota bacterium]